MLTSPSVISCALTPEISRVRQHVGLIELLAQKVQLTETAASPHKLLADDFVLQPQPRFKLQVKQD